MEGYLLYRDQVYALSCITPNSEPIIGSFFCIKSSIRLTPGYSFVGHTMFSRSGDHNVNMYQPVGFLHGTLPLAWGSAGLFPSTNSQPPYIYLSIMPPLIIHPSFPLIALAPHIGIQTTPLLSALRLARTGMAPTAVPLSDAVSC